MMNLTTSQIIAIGVGILFGVPLIVGIVVGHFFGFWPGVVAGGTVLLVIAFVAQRYMNKASKRQRENRDGGK